MRRDFFPPPDDNEICELSTEQVITAHVLASKHGEIKGDDVNAKELSALEVN